MRSWWGPVVFAAVMACARGRPNASRLGDCPGDFNVAGHGRVSLIPTGWGDPRASEVEVRDDGVLVPHLGGRAYFADRCTGVYNNMDYAALNLVGKTIKYTVDLSGTGCGCNVAFYLVPMRSNQNPSECFDYYCDANDVCGESCAEIDIMEANMHAFHSTLHTQFDHEGFGGGFGGGDGWNGPRDWNSSQFGPGGSCIDTMRPFSVATSFAADSNDILQSVEVVLTQEGHSCQLRVRLSEYPGMADLSSALSHGMTPVVSYWSSDKMLWLDGKGVDGKGPCEFDDPEKCPDSIQVYDFSIEKYVPSAEARPEHEPTHHNKWSAHKAKHHPAQPKPLLEECPGDLQLSGHGPVSIVPAGWGQEHAAAIEVEGSTGTLIPHLGSRSYFANACTAGKYNHKDYLALKLLGHKIHYTVDVSGAGCGCNVAFYLVSMQQNEQESTCSDYYCDANSVCGVPCAEIDLMEANEHAWHTTLHTEYDHEGEAVGLGGGDGWNGPRDFATWEYGPWGNCINTKKPFDVEVSFPLDSQGLLSAVELRIQQAGSPCNVAASLTKYRQMGMSELTVALAKGMTPTVSYWSSKKMLWLDGQGSDGQGACWADFPDQCGESVRLSNFTVEKLKRPEPAKDDSSLKGVCIDGYVVQPECVIEFEYKGRSVVGCTKSDAKTLVWCSHDAKYQHRWSHCQPCEVSVAGNSQKLVKSSLEVEHAEPEHVENDVAAKPEKPPTVKAQMWAQCGGVGYHGPTECVAGSTCQFMNDWWSYCTTQQSQSGSCFNNWKPHKECALHFTYDDTEFTGCTDKDWNGQGWCSPDTRFAGRRLDCTPCTGTNVEVHILQYFLVSTGLMTTKGMTRWGALIVAGTGALLGLLALLTTIVRTARRRASTAQYAAMMDMLHAESRTPEDDDLEALPDIRRLARVSHAGDGDRPRPL